MVSQGLGEPDATIYMRREGASPWGHLWAMPYFSEETIKHVDKGVLKGIFEFNNNFLRGQSESMYLRRGAYVSAFSTALEARFRDQFASMCLRRGAYVCDFGYGAGDRV